MWSLGVALSLMMATLVLQPPLWPRLAWEHDGANVTHFAICVDGACDRLEATQTSASSNTWVCQLPLLTPGFHSVIVLACNGALCTEGRPVLSIDVQPSGFVTPPGTAPSTPPQKAPPRHPPKTPRTR